MIYFALDAKNNVVKIGSSKNIHARLSYLNNFHINPVHCICTLPGDQKIEKYYHNLFKNDRIQGEWFNYSTTIQDFITSIDSNNKEYFNNRCLLITKLHDYINIIITLKTNINSKLSDLQSCNNDLLEFIGIIDNVLLYKTEFLNKFKNNNTHGTWFKLDDELLNYIESNLKSDGLELLESSKKIRSEKAKIYVKNKIKETKENINIALSQYFYLDPNSTLTVSFIREYLQSKGLKSEYRKIISASRVAKYFGLNIDIRKDNNGKSTRLIKGLNYNKNLL